MSSAPTMGSWRPVTSTSGRSARTVRFGRQLRLDEAVLVAADGVEVREVREERAEEVADQRDAVLGQPDDGSSRSSPRRRRCSSIRSPSTVRSSRSSNVMSGVGCGLAHRARRGSPWRCGVASVPSMSNQMPAVRMRSALDARVVGLAGRVVRLGDVGGARLLEQVDAADVVDVGLGGDDVVGRARPARRRRPACGAAPRSPCPC